MKYQQLQMGFLNSKNSNKNSLYYLQKERVFVVLKDCQFCEY